MARIGEDAEAFEAFYREHVDAVLQYATRRTDDPHDAADLVAEVFLAAMSFTISLTAAWILHNHVERPMRRLILLTAR